MNTRGIVRELREASGEAADDRLETERLIRRIQERRREERLELVIVIGVFTLATVGVIAYAVLMSAL